MAIQALAYAPKLALGLAQSINSYNRIQELNTKPLPQYNLQPSQQNVNMYDTRFRQGLSPEELGGMRQQFASEQAGMYRAASENSGGQLSSFLGRVSGFDRIRQASQLGSMMASERRAAMSGLAGARQSLEAQMNRQTSQDYSRRMNEEQALGGGLKIGTEGIGDALTMGLYTGLTNQGIFDTGVASTKANVPGAGNNMNTNYPDYRTPEEMGLNIRSPRFISPAASKINSSKYNTFGKYVG
tara:strand:+ start:108 stop:833 length:726 start_codon:yes stop_codon:yes gene_type:complete